MGPAAAAVGVRWVLGVGLLVVFIVVLLAFHVFMILQQVDSLAVSPYVRTGCNVHYYYKQVVNTKETHLGYIRIISAAVQVPST